MLNEAVEFIRGTPFSKPPARRGGGYQWAYSDGIYYYAESLAIDAAHFLARAHLERNDPEAALEVTARGLAATKHAEVLYQDRMDAHHALGNLQAVKAEVDALIKANDIIDPCEQLDDDTLRRFEGYTRRPYGAPAGHQAAN